MGATDAIDARVAVVVTHGTDIMDAQTYGHSGPHPHVQQQLRLLLRGHCCWAICTLYDAMGALQALEAMEAMNTIDAMDAMEATDAMRAAIAKRL